MSTQLQTAFRFDEEDLAANRAGYLSSKQERRLKKDDAFATWFAVILALLFGLGALLTLLPFVRGTAIISAQVSRFILGIGLILLTAWAIRGATTKLDYEVRSVQGAARLEKSVSRSGLTSDREIERTNIVSHKLVVGGRAFGVSPHLFDSVLQEGETYILYFIENPEILLSLERSAKV